MSSAISCYNIENFKNLTKSQQKEIVEKFPYITNPPVISRNNIAMFIVPNRPTRVESYDPKYAKSLNERRYRELVLYSQISPIEQFYHIKLDKSDWLIEMWFTDRSDLSGTSNLSEGYAWKDVSMFGMFPKHIPLRLIKNLKEGDIIRISGPRISFTVQALQEPYRYREYGTFEETLKVLMDREDMN